MSSDEAEKLVLECQLQKFDDKVKKKKYKNALKLLRTLQHLMTFCGLCVRRPLRWLAKFS